MHVILVGSKSLTHQNLLLLLLTSLKRSQILTITEIVFHLAKVLAIRKSRSGKPTSGANSRWKMQLLHNVAARELLYYQIHGCHHWYGLIPVPSSAAEWCCQDASPII